MEDRWRYSSILQDIFQILSPSARTKGRFLSFLSDEYQRTSSRDVTRFGSLFYNSTLSCIYQIQIRVKKSCSETRSLHEIEFEKAIWKLLRNTKLYNCDSRWLFRLNSFCTNEWMLRDVRFHFYEMEKGNALIKRKVWQLIFLLNNFIRQINWINSSWSS